MAPPKHAPWTTATSGTGSASMASKVTLQVQNVLPMPSARHPPRRDRRAELRRAGRRRARAPDCRATLCRRSPFCCRRRAQHNTRQSPPAGERQRSSTPAARATCAPSICRSARPSQRHLVRRRAQPREAERREGRQRGALRIVRSGRRALAAVHAGRKSGRSAPTSLCCTGRRSRWSPRTTASVLGLHIFARARADCRQRAASALSALTQATVLAVALVWNIVVSAEYAWWRGGAPSAAWRASIEHSLRRAALGAHGARLLPRQRPRHAALPGGAAKTSRRARAHGTHVVDESAGRCCRPRRGAGRTRPTSCRSRRNAAPPLRRRRGVRRAARPVGADGARAPAAAARRSRGHRTSLPAEACVLGAMAEVAFCAWRRRGRRRRGRPLLAAAAPWRCTLWRCTPRSGYSTDSYSGRGFACAAPPFDGAPRQSSPRTRLLRIVDRACFGRPLALGVGRWRASAPPGCSARAGRTTEAPTNCATWRAARAGLDSARRGSASRVVVRRAGRRRRGGRRGIAAASAARLRRRAHAAGPHLGRAAAADGVAHLIALACPSGSRAPAAARVIKRA